ncbi:MAG: aminotransferase class III-fold pyridoxal phosphate-dependent enzyme [Clostridiales bacterium]|nr:aminotransferase class III-fold pyridoxal phosphate-dependent enzyme [Clostridiales bacterium]
MHAIKEMDQAYILNTYHRLDVVIVSGQGAEVYDETGKRYIDLGSGVAVNTFGAADKEWADAVCRQARKLQHASNYYFTGPQSELAAMLCARTGMKGVFFSNSGAESNECAIKAARKYGNDRYGIARPNIITLKNSFHGRTITTLSATGQEEFHQHFMPFTPGFVHVEPDDIGEMEQAMDESDCCAVMMELIQGEGGVRALDYAYVREVARMAEQRDMLLVIDEVQTGNGRTGELYCYKHYGIWPDIVSTAKGLAGGLPFGATLFNEKTRHVLGEGLHGSTFGGNPVSAAGALNVLSRIDDALLAGVGEKSAYIRETLTGVKGVRGISGLGLMLGIETGRDAGDILAGCLKRGVLALTAKGRIRLLPPLNIPQALLAEAITILKEEIEA